MTKLPPFDPADLKPIRQLHKEGRIPMRLRHVLDLCARRKFPCVKVGKAWCTTEAAIRHYLWGQASPEFKKITS